MSLTGLLIFLVTGAVAGWLAGTLLQGGGFGFLNNMLVGLLGACTVGVLLGMMGVTTGGLIGSILTATMGTVVLLCLASLFKKSPKPYPP